MQGMECHRNTKRMVRSYPRPTTTISQVARPEAALQVLGQEQSSARSALEEALKTKEDVPKPMHPEHRVAEASARCEEIGGSFESVRRERPRCRTSESRPQAGTVHARVRPVGERFDLCLQYVARVTKQLARVQPKKSRDRRRRS